MKPGKARKDRPKGAKSFSRGSNKRVERSAVARPEKRETAEMTNQMLVKDFANLLNQMIVR